MQPLLLTFYGMAPRIAARTPRRLCRKEFCLACWWVAMPLQNGLVVCKDSKVTTTFCLLNGYETDITEHGPAKFRRAASLYFVGYCSFQQCSMWKSDNYAVACLGGLHKHGPWLTPDSVLGLVFEVQLPHMRMQGRAAIMHTSGCRCLQRLRSHKRVSFVLVDCWDARKVLQWLSRFVKHWMEAL